MQPTCRFRWLLSVLAIVSLVNVAHALDPNRTMSQYIHDQWRTEQGFPGGAVYAISQSADGYLWIGTERGLVRFDGMNFLLVRQPIKDLPALGPVRGLASDSEGNMWIRMQGSKLLRYRDGVFEDALARFHLEEVTFTAMSLDHQGELLLTGFGSGTIRYRMGKFETLATSADTPGAVISLAETRDGKIWAGTRDEGLYRISNRTVSPALTQLVNAKINTLLSVDGGGLWIGTDNGPLFWDGSALTDTRLPSSLSRIQTLAMAKDREINVWVGSDRGLLRINARGTVSMDGAGGKTGGEVTAVYEDREGDLWYGGPLGIERLRDSIFTTYSTAENLPSERNGPVYVDEEGRTWFAPLAGGLYWMKEGHVGRVTAAGIDDDVIYSISGGKGEARGSQSDIWIGRQRGGLTRLAGNISFAARTYTRSQGLAQNSVYTVHRNRDGAVWAGTLSGGVSRLKDGTFTNYTVADGLGSNTITSIVEGFDGTMWFGTANGLDAFTGGHWKNLTAADGLPSANIQSIFEDSNHALWIATSRGIAVLSAGHIAVPSNLPEPLSEQIFGIAQDWRGFLWIATSDHVLQVNRDRLLSGQFKDSDIRSYGVEEGLHSTQGVKRDRSVVSDSSGHIWMSLDRGLSAADPNLSVTNSAPTMVRVESVSSDGSRIDLQGSRGIPSGSQRIAIDYAGISLSVPERVRFRYKLDGFDQNWSDPVTVRQAIYTNLGPGSYHFRVVASNSEGLWNGAETVLPFTIKPAFWQTWWFRLSCMLAALLAVAALYRLRMYKLTQQLNVRFEERLAERTRIAQELHDTLLQGFLSASMQLHIAEGQLPADSPARPLLRRILQLMSEVITEGRNTLRGLRTTEMDYRNLELAFSRIRQELAGEGEIDYRVIAGTVTRPVHPLIRDEVYRIGREALVNAFRHAQARSIEVEVEYASSYLRVVVRDDGCGIDQQVLRSGRDGHWGLPGMRERSEGIGATLKLWSRTGAGTEVELTVPSSIAFEGRPQGQTPQWLGWLNREKFKSGSNGQGREANR